MNIQSFQSSRAEIETKEQELIRLGYIRVKDQDQLLPGRYVLTFHTGTQSSFSEQSTGATITWLAR